MATSPPSEVIDAIHGSVTSVTRRIAVFEADAETPYWPLDGDLSGDMKDGSISVDTTRDERRSLDLTLDNSSGRYKRDPDGGFWYDKIIKVFRGIEYMASERYEDLILRSGPSLYFRMGDAVIARDLGPWGRHAYRSGAPVVVAPITRSPDAPGAVRFSGSGAYMGTGTLPDAFPAVNWTAFTLEAWVRPIGSGDAWGGNIFGRDDIDVRIQVAEDGRFQAYVVNAALGVANAQDDIVAIPGRIYHVAATWDGTSVKLYRDGKKVAEEPLVGPMEVSTLGFAIGGDSSGVRRLRGDVAEAAYYDRALSAQEIGLHYVSGVNAPRTRSTWESQVGEFMIDKISEPRFPKTTKLTCRDMTKKCLGPKLSVPMSFDAATRLEDLVRAMGANAGITKFNLPNSGVTLGEGFAFDRGTPRWEVIKKACEASTYEAYFTLDGYLTMRKQLDPSTSPSSLTLLTGPKGNLVDWEKASSDALIYNKVVCTSTGNSSALPFYGEALNADPTSPTSIPRLGERTKFFESAFYTSDAQCAAAARQYLTVQGLESFDVNFQSLVFPWLEGGEIIEFIDPDAPAYDPRRFLLSSLNIPMKLGAMSGNARRIINVSNVAVS